jgi:hypothetical protein
MAFKRPIMEKFFDAWREAWNEWIYPQPFLRLVRDDSLSSRAHVARAHAA